MTVIITDFARTHLRDIYDYYCDQVSENVASKLINKILNEVEDLERYPTLGVKEPLLAGLKLDHKFIVAGNYKVIFYSEDKKIYVTDIFDGRQNPSKIITRNKKK